ncbi:unnamed protein product [Paramecium sonneborni]|uniref:Uncharacterized protein n=1 Tax=Paramecium sonneborni TaxID=65129 RepID=A0A8S1R824_9CILI|nr:unnamed protein product [Paramecium sonneborni]
MADDEICQNINLGDCSKNDGNLREAFNKLSTFNNPYKLHNEKFLKLAQLLNDQNYDQEIQNILGSLDPFNDENGYYSEFQKIEQQNKLNQLNNFNNMVIGEKDVIERKIAQQLIDEYQTQLKLSENQLFGMIYSHKNNEKFGHFLIMKNQQIGSIEKVQSEKEVSTLVQENDLSKLCAILGCAEFFNEQREKQVQALSLNRELYLMKFDNKRELISCQDYVNGVASNIRIQEITVKHFEGARYYLIK